MLLCSWLIVSWNKIQRVFLIHRGVFFLMGLGCHHHQGPKENRLCFREGFGALRKVFRPCGCFLPSLLSDSRLVPTLRRGPPVQVLPGRFAQAKWFSQYKKRPMAFPALHLLFLQQHQLCEGLLKPDLWNLAASRMSVCTVYSCLLSPPCSL